MSNLRTYLLAAAAFLAPGVAFAHEVYVLSPETVRAALAADSPNPFTAYIGNEYHFFFWGLISFITMSTILAASAFHLLERRIGPFLARLKRFAHPVARVTVGICLIGFGTSADLFGTELPFGDIFGPLTSVMQYIFVMAGAAVVLGFYTRYIALILIAIYGYAVCLFGSYMFTYTDHLGAYFFLFALGSGTWSIDHRARSGNLPRLFNSFARSIQPYAFVILRLGFGFGVMFAAVYAKFIHSELALQTVLQHNLTDFFPFEPLFIVLGALIIEFLAGLMIFTGIAIRWTGLFLIFWLTLSQIYFGELWWVHAVLFGIGFAIFCHGYDRFSVEGHVLKRGRREPVL
ncbi:hypothetical protein K8R03_02050 [Candidatus Kaiserbacteria bacterium]|nr:hypothetical protein [Candidatus Kaiserbacteria bacterium]